jgi:hypothetical protein
LVALLGLHITHAAFALGYGVLLILVALCHLRQYHKVQK